jgi:predicted HTH transcriptional regulator
MKELVFVSSVQKELAVERQAIRDFIRGDALLGHYFDVFLFEDLPANNQTPDQLYIAEVDRSAVYLGIFSNEYGWEDNKGLSPTEREFDRATLRKKNRLVFVKGTDDSHRHDKMKALIRKAERQLTRRRFVDIADLRGKVYASLIRHLEHRGVLPHRPFHAAACHGAVMRDINAKAVGWFIQRARDERQLALSPTTVPKDALTKLNLLDNGKPTNAAMLLFGNDPQKFLPSAEVKCLHFHGTTVVKPIPSYKVFKGTLFEQVDEAVNFVMSKLDRTVGTRAAGPAAPVHYEIPRDVLAEAIVNAVAHRDYASAAAIQVYVFADRFEVWNPGELPPSLTPESLRQQHPSLPRNPLIAEQLFLAHYIEKVGTGTLDVIAGCQASELPEPEFFQNGDQFVLRIWRDWLTADVLTGLDLNERQTVAVAAIKQQRRITTREYQRVTGATRATTKRDLEGLVGKNLLTPMGAGRGAYYELPTKRPINGSIGSSGPESGIGSETAQSAHHARAETRQKPDKPDTPKKGIRKPLRSQPRKQDINRTNRTPATSTTSSTSRKRKISNANLRTRKNTGKTRKNQK